MLYQEFLDGTGARDTLETYAEYRRVEQIYMESDHMTKADAYRMAVVETEAQFEARMKKERALELAWAKENIIPSAAYIRGMAEKGRYFRAGGYYFLTPAGNFFELKLERDINGHSEMLYSFWCNGKKVLNELLPSANFQSYYADWHDKTLKELQDLFGYIARKGDAK